MAWNSRARSSLRRSTSFSRVMAEFGVAAFLSGMSSPVLDARCGVSVEMHEIVPAFVRAGSRKARFFQVRDGPRALYFTTLIGGTRVWVRAQTHPISRAAWEGVGE